MTVERKEPTAKALAEAFAASLKPGKQGTPIIEEWDGASFVVRGSESGERYRVTVESLPAAQSLGNG